VNHSDKIARILKIKGWSSLEMARRADVGRERARRMALKIPSSVSAAIRIAKTLEVPVEWLFNDQREWAEYERYSNNDSNASPADRDISLMNLGREVQNLLISLVNSPKQSQLNSPILQESPTR